MNTAEMAGREFDAEKWNVKLLDAQTRQVQLLVCKMEFNGWVSPGIYWHGRRREGWANIWTNEVESSTQTKLAWPLSRAAERSIVGPSWILTPFSSTVSRRKTRTFWTGGGSWPSFKRKLELWSLLMRKIWSSGGSCGEWSSVVMLWFRLLTHAIHCSSGLLNLDVSSPPRHSFC